MPKPQPVSELPTRDQILGLLRLGSATVDELAAELGLTANGIRAQLAMLERDGMVERKGVRHGEAPGKPPHLYGVTATAEAQFSVAHAPALTGLVAALAERLPPKELHAIFTTAGHHVASGAAPSEGGSSAERVRVLLESLGAASSVRREGKRTLVEGVACPLADVVRTCPDSCELVRSMLAASTGATVVTECDHGDVPRCRFHVS